MALSIDNDKFIIEENLGSIAVNQLQKVLNDDTKSAESTELTSSTTPTNTHIDDMMFLVDVNNIATDSPHLSSPSSRVMDAYVENFGSAEQGLISTLNSLNTSIRSDTDSVSLIGEQQSQDLITPIDNHQIENTTERHIMISYNDLSFDICQKLYHRLKNLGYKVWMDEYNLHGRIFEAMAQGIQNSYIVLICYTENYSTSDYCLQEAAYTFDKRIDFIPCRLQESYKPEGWLGIFISDRLYIDFSPSNDFENSFKKLIDEIESIKTSSQTYAHRNSSFRWNNNDRNIRMNNQRMREQFNTIIREYKESINKNDQDLNLLDKDELCQLIIRLRERLFDDTLLLSNHNENNSEQRNLNNDRILYHLFEQQQNQTELLRKITEILSKTTDFKTVIKLSMALLFVWTVKTHIIDAYLKQK